MSRRKRGQPKPFLGHAITKSDQSRIVSLIGMTTLCEGLSKRKIKSEDQIWEHCERVFGLKPCPKNAFMENVRTIQSHLKKMTLEQRMAARSSAGLLKTSKGKRVYSISSRDAFYRSWDWRTLRMEVLKEQGAECQCCGSTRHDLAMDGSKVRICVDHIQPLSKRWDLRLNKDNLQVLCDECNQGKGAWDETDHRPPPEPEPHEGFSDVVLEVLDGGLSSTPLKRRQAAL